MGHAKSSSDREYCSKALGEVAFIAIPEDIDDIKRCGGPELLSPVMLRDDLLSALTLFVVDEAIVNGGALMVPCKNSTSSASLTDNVSVLLPMHTSSSNVSRLRAFKKNVHSADRKSVV